MPASLDTVKIARQLRIELGALGALSAAELAKRLGISQPSLSRLTQSISDELLVVGRARATRYVLRRTLPECSTPLPLYEIDAGGKTRTLARLHPFWPRGVYVESLSSNLQSELFDDLPYFLHDMRVAGFLGRLVPRQHPDLGLPQDINLWSGDHHLSYLARFGWNTGGNLIVGEQALQRYVENIATPPHSISVATRARHYPRLAQDVLSAGPVGSSAAGEQPKFLTWRGPKATAVLVKFSPPVSQSVGRRIADLLIAEHIAHFVLREHGHASTQSQLIITPTQVFLEMERFDRTALGRRGLMSLAALDLQYVGKLESWPSTATILAKQGHLDAATLLQINWLHLFGQLIANTDMHLGNLSVFTSATQIQSLAPAYDMLPMLYAPQQGHLPTRTFAPPLPPPHTDAPMWGDACQAAEQFWLLVHKDKRVSAGFRKIAGQNAGLVAASAKLSRLLPN